MSVVRRTWIQRLWRYTLVVVVMSWPAWNLSLPVSPFAIIAGVLLAYEGIERGEIIGFFAVLVGTELIYGIDVGILSLAFLYTVIVGSGIRRWFAVQPLAREHGWPPGALARSVIVATALSGVMSFFSISIGVLMYRYGSFAMRLQMTVGRPASWILMLALATLGVLVLRRIDVPFRRQITFGV